MSSDARKPILRHIGQTWKCLLGVKAIASFAIRGGKKMSLGANSRLGLLYTLLHVLTARFFKIQTCIHHHSYAYINNHSKLMRAVCSVAGLRSKHVFLSKSMLEKFESIYPVCTPSHILSNAPFVPIRKRERTHSSTTTVGLLSNLSPEKGLMDFLETARLAKEAKLPVRMLLAGPVARMDDARAISDAVEAGIVEWQGPLYGEQKYHFFDSIDLFLFPTRYQHEAQPTVIYEAFASGVPVISFDRGTIGDQVEDCLLAINPKDNFSEVAIELIRQYTDLSAEEKSNLCDRAREIHERHSALSLRKLRDLYED